MLRLKNLGGDTKRSGTSNFSVQGWSGLAVVVYLPGVYEAPPRLLHTLVTSTS